MQLQTTVRSTCCALHQCINAINVQVEHYPARVPLRRCCSSSKTIESILARYSDWKSCGPPCSPSAIDSWWLMNLASLTVCTGSRAESFGTGEDEELERQSMEGVMIEGDGSEETHRLSSSRFQRLDVVELLLRRIVVRHSIQLGTVKETR